MSGEIDAAVRSIRSQDKALGCLRAAVAAVLSSRTEAVRLWYADYSPDHDPCGFDAPPKMTVLKDAMAVAFPEPQPGEFRAVTQEQMEEIVAQGTRPQLSPGKVVFADWSPQQKFRRRQQLHRPLFARNPVITILVEQWWVKADGTGEWREVPIDEEMT